MCLVGYVIKLLISGCSSAVWLVFAAGINKTEHRSVCVYALANKITVAKENICYFFFFFFFFFFSSLFFSDSSDRKNV